MQDVSLHFAGCMLVPDQWQLWILHPAPLETGYQQQLPNFSHHRFIFKGLLFSFGRTLVHTEWHPRANEDSAFLYSIPQWSATVNKLFLYLGLQNLFAFCGLLKQDFHGRKSQMTLSVEVTSQMFCDFFKWIGEGDTSHYLYDCGNYL